MAKLTDKLNPIVALLTTAMLTGLVGLWAGYSVGIQRGFDAGLKYVDEGRRVEMREAFDRMNQTPSTAGVE